HHRGANITACFGHSFRLPAVPEVSGYGRRRGPLRVCSGKRYRAGLLPAFIRPALISLPLMVTSIKQRGCVAALTFLSVLSLSHAQTNPTPAAPAQAPEPPKFADHPPMLLVQAPAPA